MKDLEILREKYKPEKIRILFVGESPPKREFFYEAKGSNLGRATKEAFEKTSQKEFESYQEFLEFFKSQGCYLVDLFQERGKKIIYATEEEKEEAEKQLTEFIAKHKPEIVVAVLKRICKHVEKAVKETGVSVEVRCLLFPNKGKNREEYIKGLIEILKRHYKFLLQKEKVRGQRSFILQPHKGPSKSS